MTARGLHIGYAVLAGLSDPEQAAARAWLADTFVEVTDVDLDADAMVPEADVVWIHGPDGEAGETPPPMTSAALQTLGRYVKDGGRLLFTNTAAYLPHAMGIESKEPETRSLEVVDGGYGRARGFQSFLGHPLFDSFFGGGYVSNRDEDHVAFRTGYFDDSWPKQGHVVAIDKSYITLHERSRLIVEHRYGRGVILSIGAYVQFHAEDRCAAAVRRFVRSAIDYLVQAPDIDVAHTWRRLDPTPVPVEIEPRKWTPSSGSGGGGEPREPTTIASSSAPASGDVFNADALPTLFRDEATDNFFDVAGRRCVAMGIERGGISELWCHPFRILRDLEIGVVTDGEVVWLSDVPCRIEVYPHAFVRRYRLPRGAITEMILTSRDEPVAAVRFRADHEVHLFIRHAVDFRLMWPYEAGALGPLHYGHDGGALHVRDESSRFYALFGADHPPEQQLAGPFDDITLKRGTLAGARSDAYVVQNAAVYALDATNAFQLHFAAAGSNLGREEAESAYASLLRNPDEVMAGAAAHYERLLARATLLTTPDEEFNEGYRWALLAADRFWAETPGIGTGLLAGYGTTNRGWNGGHEISGRPGYGWYFSRDAAWACMAVTGYGDFGSVREELRLFERYQDPSGKIFFELPLSGIVHYDAADSSPLYLILAATYLRASGDLGTVELLWPSLLRTIEFLYSTDTSGDGFIENKNVGHGWVEGGALFGAATELYLAALWVRALHDSAYLARSVGEKDHADRFAADASAAHARLDAEFWNEDEQFLQFAKLKDGSFNSERTIFGAIPLLLGLIAPDRAEPMLDSYAGNEFSTDWGTRIISSRSPLFDPRGYHLGTVWPLFTGWTALAEYVNDRPVSAFTHVMSNLLVYRHWGLGFVEEVLNGERYIPAGVCAHQCWSETNVLHPLLAGMLGLEPDAPRNRVRMSPRLPIDWDWLRVDNIHVGPTRFDMRFERTVSGVSFAFKRTAGPAVEVALAPLFPLGTTMMGLEADVDATYVSEDTTFASETATFRLEDAATLRFATSGGIGAIPLIPRPEPGETSGATRIVGEQLDAGVYTLFVEGAPESTATFHVRHFGRRLFGIAGAEAGPAHSDSDAKSHPDSDANPDSDSDTNSDSHSEFGEVIHLRVTFPESDAPWIRQQIAVTLGPT